MSSLWINRKGIWALLGMLLLMLGFDHAPIGESEAGSLIAILGLVAGMLIIAFAMILTLVGVF